MAAAQIAAITTQNQEQLRLTRAERYQLSQDGHAVAAAQIAAITTQNQQQMRRARQSGPRTHGAAYSSAPASASARHVLGPCTFECIGCSALHFKQEKSKRGFFSCCCAKGKASLPPLDPTRHVLVELFRACETFMPYIRAYNLAMSFASIGSKVDDALIDCSHGTYTFRIHGSM